MKIIIFLKQYRILTCPPKTDPEVLLKTPEEKSNSKKGF